MQNDRNSVAGGKTAGTEACRHSQHDIQLNRFAIARLPPVVKIPQRRRQKALLRLCRTDRRSNKVNIDASALNPLPYDRRYSQRTCQPGPLNDAQRQSGNTCPPVPPAITITASVDHSSEPRVNACAFQTFRQSIRNKNANGRRRNQQTRPAAN